MTASDDMDCLGAAAAAELGIQSRGHRWTHLPLCVLDAVFSINARYTGVIRVCHATPTTPDWKIRCYPPHNRQGDRDRSRDDRRRARRPGASARCRAVGQRGAGQPGLYQYARWDPQGGRRDPVTRSCSPTSLSTALGKLRTCSMSPMGSQRRNGDWRRCLVMAPARGCRICGCWPGTTTTSSPTGWCCDGRVGTSAGQ